MELITCVVVDEAHKATGNYAYAAIARRFQEKRICYRMLALSATPGSDKNKIQEVVDNLGIAKVEFRAEEDPDVRQYMHVRNVEVVTVDPTDELQVRSSRTSLLKSVCARVGVRGLDVVSNTQLSAGISSLVIC